MARINLSIPDDLRTRMADLDKRFNWSEVAAAAFEREIANANFNEENMETVIERLRASKVEYERDQEGNGKREGAAWAKNSASFHELRTLARLGEDLDAGRVHYDEEDDLALGGLVDRKLGRNPRDEGIEASFWFEPDEEATLVPSNQYVLAYLAGVSEVWDEVADKI